MRSYNNLWSDLISDENIILAIKHFRKGRTQDKYVQWLTNNQHAAVKLARDYALANITEDHVEKVIVDGSCGKRRSIIRPSRREQVLHHMIINILSSIFLRPMYNHVHAAIPGRGCLSGKKTLEKWIKRDYKGTKYYLKMDIRKYFESVPHEILKAKLAKIIKDKRFLTLVNNTIDIKCNGKYLNKGIPLGFYTSQWYANFYLTGLDHYIKEKLHAPYYMRYMDDMVILGGNKRKLIKIQQAIAEYLKENLGLTMKENWIISKLGYEDNQSIDFMGFRFYRNRVTLRKILLLRLTRKALQIHKKGATIYTARQFLSLVGWTKHANVYRVYKKRVAPYVSKRAIRRKISNYDKRSNYVTKFAINY